MAATATSSARSNYGCWTCRVRKKKCDESHPTCSTCNSLGLECSGYGKRPTWMDNGQLQKEQALKIKQVVGQNNHKRRKSQALRSTPLPFPGMNIIESKVASPIAPPMSVSSVENNADISSVDETYLVDWGQLDSWITDLDMPSIDSREDNLNTELILDQIIGHSDVLDEEALFDGHDPISSGASHISRYPDSIFSSSVNIPTVQTGEGVAGAQMENGNLPGAATFPLLEPSSKTSIYDNPTSAIEMNPKPTPPSADLEATELQNKMEDGLFMHYLDDVFDLQFPFYNLPNKRPRGWIFSSFKQSRLVYHATLALSQYSIRSAGNASLLPRFSNWRNHYEIAHRESENLHGEIKKSNILARSIGILQLLFYEIFAGGTGNWQRYLYMASPLIRSLVKAFADSSTVISHNLNHVIQRKEYKDIQSVTEQEESTEMQVVLGSFIWIDIMASASTRSVLTLNIDHQQTLDTFGVDLRFLFGCSHKISTLILEIVHLDNWKKEAKKNCQLSMVELVKRGAKIEESICQHIEDLRLEDSLQPSRSTDEGYNMSAAQIEITRIFALSAQTYLHVIISGAHPEMPEIAESVSKTIDAMKALSNPQLLRSVVWPVCVTGCLATKLQQSIIRELVSKAGITSSTLGTGWQTLQTIEKHWDTRKNSSSDWDWVSIMKMRNYNILLV